MHSLAFHAGRAGRAALRWYSIPLLFAVWQAAAISGLASPRILPDLRIVWEAFVGGVARGEIPFHAAVSLERALSGFALAVVAGVLTAVAMAGSRTFERLLEPVFFLGYPVPKLALFPVFTFIFGIGTPSKVAFIFLECLYPIVIATYFGIRGIDRVFLWSAQTMGASPSTIFWRVQLPAAAPAIFTGIRIALPISIIVVIITEMIGDNKGLGYYITIAGASFRYEKVYAGIAAVGICGFVLDRALAAARSRLIHWQRESPVP